MVERGMKTCEVVEDGKEYRILRDDTGRVLHDGLTRQTAGEVLDAAESFIRRAQRAAAWGKAA